MSIKVIIAGFKGRMGQAAYKMVSEDPELELAGLIDPFTDETEVAGVSVFNYKEDVVGLEADVWVDFTMQSSARSSHPSPFHVKGLSILGSAQE